MRLIRKARFSVTADLARLLQGALFTRDFLIDGIRGAPEYAALDDDALAAAREMLAAIFTKFPTAKTPSESQSEDDLIWPVLTALGWTTSLRQQNLSAKGREDVPDGLLFADDAEKAKANRFAEEWKRYALGVAIVESKRWQRPLDRRSNRRGEGDETAPSTQMLRYLRRVDVVTNGKLEWGVLTNGAKWRLYFQEAKSVSEEFCELDLPFVLGIASDAAGLFELSQEDLDHWLRVFLLIFRRTSFLPTAEISATFLQRALDEGRFYEERVAKSLANLVFDRAFPALARGIADADPSADLESVRSAAFILLYRLLFLLYAEDRDLLPVRDKRFDDYSLRERVRLDVGRRKAANDTFSSTATKYWGAIDDLCRAIDKGDGSIGLPPYNGGLFDAARTPLLADIRLSDELLADVVDILSFDSSGPERRYINYRDLSVQQLGSIYERLLEHELVRAESGLIAVRPNIFARKRSGSYYTPEELVGVILEETLKPLIEERMAAFEARVAEIAASPVSDPIAALAPVDPAQALLELRICDPAMGSGHFLVSLVDALTDHVINAIAEAAETVRVAQLIDEEETQYHSPLIDRIDEIRRRITGNADQQGWALDRSQLDDRHIIRRMVLKRCIYGVDKNPMAVELAKVSLWLHTFTVGAPLSFLDHHLRCGDSLFGLSVHGALGRLSDPRRWGGKDKGLSLLINDPLNRAMSSAAQMQTIERLTDAEIAEAHLSADIWKGVVVSVAPLDAVMQFLQALDWLAIDDNGEKTAVKAYLDGMFGDPFDIARGRVLVDETRPHAAAFLAVLARARALAEEEHFFNWQTAFPGVWKDWEAEHPAGGFDAVIGNPPWDRMKMQEVEWFAARRRDIASATRADERKRLVEALKEDGDPLYADYERAAERAEDAVRIARTSGDYPLLSGGDLNVYSLFVERASALVKPSGIVGLLTPSGIASDKTAAPFFKSIATSGRLRALFDCENRGYFFPDIHNSFKFCAIVFGAAERTFPVTECAFYLHRMSELPERRFELTASDFARVNPNTGTAPIFRTRRDADLVRGIYERCPVLVHYSNGVPLRQWPVEYDSMLHMTNDSRHFNTREELQEKEGAYQGPGHRLQNATGTWAPLYEGKMVQAYDHRAASVVVNPANTYRPASPRSATAEQHKEPGWSPEPQFWVLTSKADLPPWEWRVGFKDVTATTNVRTMIAAAIPATAVGNTFPTLSPVGPIDEFSRVVPAILATLNSVPFDYVARRKVQGQHLNWYIVEQLPVPPWTAVQKLKFGDKSAADIIREAVLELTYTAHDMAPFARDMGHVDAKGNVLPPFTWDEERRLKLRAKLDAVFFHLYGVTDREDVRYIYSTFPIVEQQETAAYGSYRSRELCLAYMNALAAGHPDADVQA